MTIRVRGGHLHWNYFLALERDLETMSRYVEFVDQNLSTYSIELAHLLFAAASEVDVVAKLVCERVAPDAPRRNIDEYRQALVPKLSGLPAAEVLIERYDLSFCPWENWGKGDNPDWWRSYNNVKHERATYFHEATLKNTINALGALLVLIYRHQAEILYEGWSGPRELMRIDDALFPRPAMMRLRGDPLYEHMRGARGV